MGSGAHSAIFWEQADSGSLDNVRVRLGGGPTPGNGTAINAAASKAVETLGRGPALELVPRRVDTISPGPIDTPMQSKAHGEGRDAFVSA
ncbi:MAG: short-chain dehydrogenase protein [Devosia sp.]|jgi:NAD(P)-dependent dehydrogenase (short-subunit alcohol dehydrogenase family)|nr:short-chain dehydrogenase protein [Devosia sp.]